MTAGAIPLLPQRVRDSTLLKALAGYASISWLLLQIVSTFMSGLGLPDWVFTGFLWILIAGLPVLLFAARASERRADPQFANAPGIRLGRLTFRKAFLGGGLMVGAWIVVVGSFMASWAFGIGPAASLMAAGRIQQSDPVLIADFANKSHDPVLASTVTEAIRLDLSQSNVIRIVDRDDVGDALKRMDLKADTPLAPDVARNLAVREGMAAVLHGQVSSLGSATVIAARLVNPQDGQTLAEYHETAKNEDELVDAVDRLSSTLRNKIGEPLMSIRREPPLAKVTTASMPALRAFTMANQAHADGDEHRAVLLLREALSHDRRFPMAWRKLGALLSEDEPAQARLAYTNAYQLRANLPERERGLAEASYYKNVAHDLPQAVEAYRRILATHPNDEVALNNLANLYTAFHKPAEAMKLQKRIVAINPRFAAYSNLFNNYIRLGQLDRAAEVHQTAAKLFPEQKRIKFQPIMLAFARGDYAESDRLVNAFLESNKGKEELTNDLFIARYHWKRGRFSMASEIFRARAERAAQKGKIADALEAMTSLVAIARVDSRPADGRAILADALLTYRLDHIPPDLRPYLDLAEAFAVAGDAASARRYLALAEAQVQKDATFNYDQRRRTLGLIALNEGRLDDAIQELQKASTFGQCTTCVLYDLGLALEKAGRPSEALAVYQRYRMQAPFALTRGEYLGSVLARMVDLQRRIGGSGKVEALAQDLRRLWGAAAEPLLAQSNSAPGGPTAIR